MITNGVRFIVVSCLVAFGLIGGCTEDEDADGDSKGTLVVKVFMDITGPTKELSQAYSAGVEDFAAFANKNDGIAGYAIDLVAEDNEYSLDRTREIIDHWQSQDDWDDVVAIFGHGTHTTALVSQEMAEDEIPLWTTSPAPHLMTPVAIDKTVDIPEGVDIPDLLPDGLTVQGTGSERTLHVQLAGEPYVFAAATDYSHSARLAVDFVDSRTDSVVMAFAYDDTSTYATSPIPAGKLRAHATGITIAPDLNPRQAETYEEVEEKVKTYFADGNNSDVDWIWAGNTERTVIYLVRALAAHGPSQTKVVTNVWGMDEQAYDLCAVDLADGAANPCVGRLYGTMPFAAFGDMSKNGMGQVVDIHQAARKANSEDVKLHQTVPYVGGHSVFLMFKKAVEALDSRGEAITGRAVKEELETFASVSTGGLTGAMTLSSTDHRPTSVVNIYSIDEFGVFNSEGVVNADLLDDWRGW